MDIENIKEQLIADPHVKDMIARRAYEIYLHRQGRRGGSPAEDWLRAESEILPRLIGEIVARNRAAIRSHDASDPVAHKAAEHMRHEIEREDIEQKRRSSEAMAGNRQQLNQMAERLAEQTRSEAEEAPKTKSLRGKDGATGGPTAEAAEGKVATGSTAPKKATSKKAAPKKSAAKKAAPKKAAAKKGAAKKPAAKKAAPKKTAAKKAAPKKAAVKKPAARKAAPKKDPSGPDA